MELIDYLNENYFDYEIVKESFVRFKCCTDTFLVLEKKSKVFDLDFNFIFSKKDEQNSELLDFNKVIFFFGGTYYYSGLEEVSLNHLKYIGKVRIENDFFKEVPYVHLGIHGKYEMLNGVGDYKDYCKKAKFLGVKTLGICEQNTLAGILKFQKACEKSDIKPIIGASFNYYSKEETLNLKQYAINEDGYKQLNIQKNNMSSSVLSIKDLSVNKGVVYVLSCQNAINKDILDKFKDAPHFYYQIDLSIYRSRKVGVNVLKNIKDYIDNYSHLIKPILINDSYFIDKGQFSTYGVLRKIAKEGYGNSSRDFFFKDQNSFFNSYKPLFSKHHDLFLDAYSNTIEVSQICDFKVDTSRLHLPQISNNAKEKLREVVIDRFSELIEDKKIPHNEVEIYIERIERELEVIEKGNFPNYFLITKDIVDYANKSNILVGVGRGSACGSLVAYLCGITKLDPIKHDLVFERFLNESRIKSSLPDIDIDFEAKRRNEVKKYIESKYGSGNVVAIGSYTTLKIKALIQDLLRQTGMEFQKVLKVCKYIKESWNYTDLFRETAKKVKEGEAGGQILYDFLQNNYEMLRHVPFLLNQPKANSVHPCAIVITPENKPIETSISVRYDDKTEMHVTEMDGEDIESCGYLKEDILGIKQLDKFSHILNLIKDNYGETVSLEEVSLVDEGVYKLFRDGLTSDSFQFNTRGLTSFLKQLKPSKIEHLIAAVALYRPGTISNDIHNKYIQAKNNKSKISYKPLLKDVTKETYSYFVYQEQIMKACSIVGGFNLTETDEIRKAIGKKIMDLMVSYQTKFIEGAVNNGYTKKRATELWEEIVAFAGYSFNKSHAAAYAVTGYFSNWFKYHYPLEYFTTALMYNDDTENIDIIVDEISNNFDINVSPPCINNSKFNFTCDSKTNTIYWGVSKVEQVSSERYKKIKDALLKGGDFKSLESFVERTKMDVRTTYNLILSGSFDSIYKVKEPHGRIEILKVHSEIFNRNCELINEKNKSVFAFLQKKISSTSNTDFCELTKKWFPYLNYQDIDLIHNNNKDLFGITVTGYFRFKFIRNSKRGEFCVMKLAGDNSLLDVTLWNDCFENYRGDIEKIKDECIVCIHDCSYKFDNFHKKFVIHSKQDTKIKILNFS